MNVKGVYATVLYLSTKYYDPALGRMRSPDNYVQGGRFPLRGIMGVEKTATRMY
jgi:hypothetical protein